MLSLPAQLTLREAQATLSMLSKGIAQAPVGEIALDASPLAQIDTSALAVLLECRRQAQRRGCGLSLHGAPPRLVELARLYGVQDLLALRA